MELLIIVVKIVIVILTLVTTVAYTVLLERKVAAAIQNRIGPNKAGPFGILQTLADGMKLIFKESFTPTQAEMRP